METKWTEETSLTVKASGSPGEGKMKRALLGALAITVITGTSAAVYADNDKLEDRIEARLHHDAKLKGSDVKVDVDNGVATLKGKVANEAEKVRAERLAHVAGVTRVDNKLDIDTGAAKDRVEESAKLEKKRIDERADRAKEQVDAREERSKDRLDANTKAAKESAKDRAEHRTAVPVDHPRAEPRKNDTAGDEVSDAWITTKVKSQFIGVDALKGSDISVDTNQNGVVTLTGRVPNEAARARAIEIVRATKGVHRVVDDMKLSAR
jgi:osmotically-inducible protein OsmY